MQKDKLIESTLMFCFYRKCELLCIIFFLIYSVKVLYYLVLSIQKQVAHTMLFLLVERYI